MKGEVCRGFTVYHYGDVLEPEDLVDGMLRAEAMPETGRGAIRLFSAGERRLACRKYLHGGIFRMITADAYLSAHRAVNEMENLRLLTEKGVNVVRPVAALATRTFPFKKLFLVTVFEEGAPDLVEAARMTGRKKRLRLARGLARIVWAMCSADVYHPDLHLRNVLVTGGGLMLLDFDKAVVKRIGAEDVLRLVWRLYRYTEKLKKSDTLTVSTEERMVFLRELSRISGFAVAEEAERRFHRKLAAFKVGWLIESLLYGRGAPSAGGPKTTPRAGGESGTQGKH